ncbi:hypothetical protein RN001_000719 [Aquatica leii]|uniref:Luciferin 4-monooxygenase n=1 Tax=Aquatica leii TaxID=1421715 RepID=A0AAN7QM67_9COLE|nr:hypothetical protein RN001_000719 [Aquatica leii]
MNQNSEYIVSGPTEKFHIWYESLGTYLFDCLQKRNRNEIIAINAFTKDTLTCGDLLEKSIKLSIALKTLSVQKGDVIALITENNIQNYIITCASLFCGAKLNLLNFAYTLDELSDVFKLSKPKIIFCSKTALQNALSAKKIFSFIQKIVLIENESINQIQNLTELINDVNRIDNFKVVKVSIKDTAILCLSSGTTGLPKCVEISHENFIPLINLAEDNRYFNVTSKDTAVLILPFFHIYGLDIHLLAITNSLKVISMDAFKPDVFLQANEEYKATKMYIAPPLLQFLIKSPLVAKYNLTSVKDIVIGAAASKRDIYEEASHKFQHCVIRQIYGSTETRAMTIQHYLDKFTTAGKLVCNSTAKIINVDTNTILGPYEKGEICIKSLSIMKGYLNNPSATKNAIDSDGFYHTGDIGYYDKDKNFYVVDRIKELIKYKGFQVSPVEVENLLLKHSGVKDCALVGLPDDRCGELPLAFVVRQATSDVTEDELIKFVSEKISIQKQLHGGVRFIDKIPKLPNGKILRRKLVQLLSES